MSTEALTHPVNDAVSQQVLRIALGGALGIALPAFFGVPLPFIGAIIAVNSTSTMRRLPPAKMLLGLVAIVFAVPYAFNLVSGAFLEYPYLLLGFIWLVLFHGFRLQANPKQKLLGVLTVTFAIVVPIVTHAAGEIGPMFVQVLGLNVTLGIVAVVVAFAAFPDPGEAGSAPDTKSPEPDAASDVALMAAISATVMVPLIAVFLSYDALTAMRVLFVASTVLAAAESSASEREGWIALASVAIGGLAALGVSLVWIILPSPIVGLLLGCLATLMVGRRAVEGAHAPAYASAIGAMWVLLSTSGTDPAAKVVLWSLYAMSGACYAIGGRELLVRLAKGW